VGRKPKVALPRNLGLNDKIPLGYSNRCLAASRLCGFALNFYAAPEWSLEFFCRAGFYKDTAPTALKGKAAPVARSGFGIIPDNLFYCTTARKIVSILRTDPFTVIRQHSDFYEFDSCVFAVAIYTFHFRHFRVRWLKRSKFAARTVWQVG
jgi:hypothetical protein